MSRWNLMWLLGILGTYLVCFSISLSAPQRDDNQKNEHENVRLIIDVLDEVKKKYVKDLDPAKRRELIENMINGGLEQLDPHSAFINAEEYSNFNKQSKGKFSGIGIRLGINRSGELFVESPIPGTPAYEAGILAGDRIRKIDDESTANMPVKRAVEKITGEPGQKVKLTVMHDGSDKEVDISIGRAEIFIESILGDERLKKNLKEWDFIIDKNSMIGYIRITTFAENTARDLVQVVDQLKADGIKGLILDLRGNPGGLLKAAVEVSELFLTPGTRVVSTVGRNHKEEVIDARKPAGSNAGPYTDYPIAVLVNRFSASASEIVAGALQEAGRAIIIGERSYGKGSVQTVILMEGGTSALKLTTAAYYVGKDDKKKNIHRFPDSKESDQWGVKPNQGFDVKLTDEDRLNFLKWRRIRDIALRPGQAPPKIEDKDLPPTDFKDMVLEKAKDYIRAEIQKRAGAPAAPGLPEVHDAMLPARPSLAGFAYVPDPLYFNRPE